MSFSQTIAWEVRTTGNDGNSGGFRGGSNLGPPLAPTVTPGGAVAGGFPAGTYYVVVTYNELAGTGGGTLESPGSPETSVIVGTGHGISVTAPANPYVQGNCSYNTYIGTVSGGPYVPVNAGANSNGNVLTQDCHTNQALLAVDFTVPASPGPPGIDYTQQNGVQLTYTDLVIDGSNNQKLTSVAHPGIPSLVGNTINITSGTGFTVQRLEILNVDAAGAYYVDKSAGTVSSTAGHGVLGGALATPGLAGALLELGIDSGAVFIKSGTYTMSASNNIAGGHVTCDSNNSLWIGYNTNRSRTNQDASRPTFQAGADSITLLSCTHRENLVANIIFNANSHASITGFALTDGKNTLIRNCLSTGGCSTGFDIRGAGLVLWCEASGDTSIGFAANGASPMFLGCTAKEAAATGFFVGLGASAIFSHCVSLLGVGGSGGGGICFDCTGVTMFCFSCTADDTTGAATGSTGYATSNSGPSCQYINCLATNFNGTGSIGFSFGTVSNTEPPGLVLNCAAFNNALNFPNVAANAVHGGSVFNFVQLTQDPYVNRAGLNYGLNNVTGGGKSLRGAGVPGHTALTTFPDLSSNSFVDVGAVQTSSLVTGMLVHPGYGGGMKG